MEKYWKPVAAGLLLALLAASRGQVDDKVSKPFAYSGFGQAQYTGIKKFSAYVPMSDGVKLAIDYYVPTGGPATSFPVIIEYTPYTRAFIDINNNATHRALRKKILGSENPVIDLLAAPGAMSDAIRKLLAYGYVFVRADMRGCGASSGWKADFMPRIGQDGGEMVNWIAKQPWCDGNIGMVGGSYSGYSQIVTAGHAGPALKAIAPVVVPLDGYDGEVYPGGIYLQKFMQDYSENLQRLNLNYYTLTLKNVLAERLDLPGDRVMLPAAPVVDEDNDGDLTDEVPLDLNGNGTFLDDYDYPDDSDDPPRYSDGKAREHVYYLAIRDHRYNVDYHRIAERLLYIDAPMPVPMQNYTTYDFSPSSQIQSIMKKGIAIYNIGGWFDAFARGTTEYYNTLRAANPSRMMMHAGFHGGEGPYWAYAGEKDFPGMMPMIVTEMHRFFDHYLKGIDNGIDREDPVLIYVINGGGWRQEKEWPLARQQLTDFFLSDGHGLGRELGSIGKDRYRGDYTHDSRYGKSLGNRYLSAMGVSPSELPVRTQKDRQCLTYTSAPMSADTEVTGHPIINFWVSSSADAADFFVYLEDVDENGEAVLVSDGLVGGNYHRLVDNDEIVMGGGSGINVLPELPWHGFKKSNYDDEVFRGGKVVPIVIDFKPVSWVFKKGHSVRVSIALADWPTFRLHPRLSPNNDPRNPANVVPTITIYRGADRPSKVTLPVIPK